MLVFVLAVVSISIIHSSSGMYKNKKTEILIYDNNFVSGELSDAENKAAFDALYNQNANAYSGKV